MMTYPLLFSCLVLLPGTAMSLRAPLPLTVTRASQQQTLLASSSPRLAVAQHHSGHMAAAGHSICGVAAPSWGTRASAPQMRLRTELVAAVATSPAFLAADAFGFLLKAGWRLALAAGIGLALKPTIKDIYNSRMIRKYTSQLKPAHLRLCGFLTFAPLARRAMFLFMKKYFPGVNMNKRVRLGGSRGKLRGRGRGDADGGGKASDGGGGKGGGGEGGGEGGGGEGGDGAAGGNGGDAGGCGGKGGSGGGHIKLLIDPLMLEERSHGGITLIFTDSGSQAVAPVASWLSLSSTHEVGSRFGCRRLVNSSYETTWSYVPRVSRSSALPLGR